MLLLYTLARPIASNLSISSTNLNDTASFDPTTGECININGCRTTTGIIWSCLSVIFICTWVAIHPNIPLVEKLDHEYSAEEKKRSKHRWHPAVTVYQDVELMIIALLAPEFMILWAMRQREQAKIIGKQFDKYGWGTTHGFFVIMGGFALYNEDEFCGYLWDSDRHSKEGKDDTPFDGKAEKHFTAIKNYHERHEKVELENSNKSVQNTSEPSMPPASQHSSVANPPGVGLSTPSSNIESPLGFLVSNGYVTLTEDEIRDRSHGDLITKSIAVIQTTWFTLQVIARAAEGLAITELEIITVAFAILNFGTCFLWWNKPLQMVEKREKFGEIAGGGADEIVKYIYALRLPFFDALKSPESTFIRLLLLPLWILWHILLVCLQIIGDNDSRALAISISSRLGNDPPHPYIAVYGIAALFGAIHCIPWVFLFPTHTEQLLWRISAVAVATAPIAMGILHRYLKKFKDNHDGFKLLYWTMAILMVLLSFAYAIFRITLLVIAFTALRDLSPGAYETVQWTTFFPHIG